MPSRALPARPHLDHLKHEAKALFKAYRERDPDALRRVREILGDRPITRLSDAQRVLAREYGFATWARLRAHVVASRGGEDALAAFLAAVQGQDRDAASAVVQAHPRLPAESLHVAAALGRTEDVARLLAEDPARVRARIGSAALDPLLLLCFSPFHGESAERDASILECARMLLAAGADANTVDGRFGVSALYGVTGMHDVLPLARLLLDAGANPTDGESMFHAAERFHVDAMELLLSRGCDLNHTGHWGNTPLYFLVRWYDVADATPVRDGFLWLLDHGADPNVPCGTERETCLHVAARRGRRPETIQLLVDRGADVRARRGDGATPWRLAARGGYDEIAAILERTGADRETLSTTDALIAACGRGDVDEAKRLASPDIIGSLTPEDLALLPDAAARGSVDVVKACLSAGFPVGAVDTYGATALHHAAIHGHATLARILIDAGAPLDLRDPQHHSTPLGWATFGADFFRDPQPGAGEYEETVRAFLDAGVTPRGDEHRPVHAGVRALLE